jgi:hypothetical protein
MSWYVDLLNGLNEDKQLKIDLVIVVEISIITINIQSHTNYINLVYIIITLEGTVYILPVT